MTPTVKDHSAVLVRLLCALNGFRVKYGSWPRTVELPPQATAALVTTHLTPLGLLRLQERLALIEGAEGDIVVRGTADEVFSYSQESGHDAPALAVGWLGLELPDE